MIVSSIALDNLRSHAAKLGFAQVGVASAQASPGFDKLTEWIERGYAGTMSYIPKRHEAYRHPDFVLDGCKSIVMLAMPYQANAQTKRPKHCEPTLLSSDSKTKSQSGCQIGSYASGQADYHDLIHERLDELIGCMRAMFPQSTNRGVVDTAPLMERDFAQLAGLGWIGKNTLLLNRQLGSYFFLSALLTDVELPVSDSMETGHCGTCTACLDACPTSAFVEPHVMDASRCISYLTIEHREVVATELSRQMQDWLFGCDACQTVCPWNRKPEPIVLNELKHFDMATKTSLEHWLELDESTFRRLYRKTPFWRTKLVGMQRNALIVAANTGRYDLRETIERFLQDGNEVLVETSRWCLTRLDELV